MVLCKVCFIAFEISEKSTAPVKFSFIYHACIKNLLCTSHCAANMKDDMTLLGKSRYNMKDTCTFSEPEISMYNVLGIWGALGWALR